MEPPARLHPDWLRDLARRLTARSTPACDPAAGRIRALERARTLGRVGRRFLDPADPLRVEALRRVPSASGLSPEMTRVVLDGMARDWTPERLERLVREGWPLATSDLDPGVPERAELVSAPRLLVQLVSGSVPGVGVQALLRGLVVGAPTLLKPGLGDVDLPLLFARALREEDPELAEALAVVYWPGGSEELERAALEGAEAVVVYGGDRTVEEVRTRLPATARLVAHHHRVGVGVVGADVLADPERARGAAADVAWAAAVFDQRGCVSPRTVFVETSEASTLRNARAFVDLLADALERLERELPSGRLDRTERAVLQQYRGTAELVVAGCPNAHLRHGGAAPWTVALDPEGRIDTSASGRALALRPFGSPSELVDLLRPAGPHLQTVGVAGLEGRLEEVSAALIGLGASRICPFRAVPFPPPWWHHDGRGPLRELLRTGEVTGLNPPRAAAPLATRPSAGRRGGSPPRGR